MFFFQVQAISIEIYDYKDAVEISKETKRPIYILFVDKDCGWCSLQKEIYEKPEVINVLKEGFIVSFVDLSEEKEISKKYKVRSVPSHFILDSEGEVLKKIVGYKDKDKFLNFISK
jgi:thioredoxin-related protein